NLPGCSRAGDHAERRCPDRRTGTAELRRIESIEHLELVLQIQTALRPEVIVLEKRDVVSAKTRVPRTWQRSAGITERKRRGLRKDSRVEPAVDALIRRAVRDARVAASVVRALASRVNKCVVLLHGDDEGDTTLERRNTIHLPTRYDHVCAAWQVG